MNIQKEMKVYDLMHRLESSKNYLFSDDERSKEERQELAEFIYNNLDKLDEFELKTIALKCMSNKDIKRYLLSYELKNYNIKCVEKMSLDQFLLIALSYLNRYQWKAGGFFIEDDQWTVYRHGDYDLSTNVRANEILFENTVYFTYSHDYDTVSYLDSLTDILNSIATNISVEIRENREGKIVHLLIWATDKNMMIDDIVSL